MKRILILISVCLLTFCGFAQKTTKFTEEDAKQFYRTIQGDYTGKLDDSTTVSLHFVPIWERENDRFHWMYMEAVNNESKAVIEQIVLEIAPVSDISFMVYVHHLKTPELFVGRWSNRNFFDGFNSNILKGKKRFVFLKTKDFEYQTGWHNRKSLKCFPSGDRIHFKFVQEDERFYVTRVPSRSTNIIGYTFFKSLTD